MICILVINPPNISLWKSNRALAHETHGVVIIWSEKWLFRAHMLGLTHLKVQWRSSPLRGAWTLCGHFIWLSWSVSLRGGHLIWHTFGGLLGSYWKLKTGRNHLCTPPPPCSNVPVSLAMEISHMSSALVLTSGALGFAAAAWQMPLGHLPLIIKGACIPESHATVAIREIVLGRQPPPGHCTDWNTPSVFLWKRPICLFWSFSLRGRLPVWLTSRGLRTCSQGP